MKSKFLVEPDDHFLYHKSFDLFIFLQKLTHSIQEEHSCGLKRPPSIDLAEEFDSSITKDIYLRQSFISKVWPC